MKEHRKEPSRSGVPAPLCAAVHNTGGNEPAPFSKVSEESEYGPQNIHVGHVIVDGGIEGDRLLSRVPRRPKRLALATSCKRSFAPIAA
jgi:hypothetical protein